MGGDTAGRAGDRPERCVHCHGSAIVRRGFRRKKFELVQLWRCRSCGRTFPAQRASGKTYPLKLILQALTLFYQGETRERTVELIRQRFGIAVPVRTLASWLAEYRELTTYAPMRKKIRAAFPPDRLVRTVRLHHQQVRQFRVHQGKLAALLGEPGQRALAPIADYLDAVPADVPQAPIFGNVARFSTAAPFDGNAFAIRRRDGQHACRVADLVLPSTGGRRQHDEVLQFMLWTDSATVVVEVPIYLAVEDGEHLRASGFDRPAEPPPAPAAYIDVLQIRDGRIHILAYKPGACKEQPIAQLMLCALALSVLTGLSLSRFVCAWFDEHDYGEFDPVQAGR
ncbi:hypothetical protein GRI75_13190 [Altererythrobacter soli]|uniref:Uncharacterized protein n=1 Tax=Croceibacterium soli TaxID=1739690 RepID=A0A6I4UXD3_9SPHN|nr:IS1 family transposase [Croceibacterium soli]MXP42594.1 hypothetical protein [Croceibacterium soli]